MLYIVVNIGCIECGVSSDIVGVFDDERLADSVCSQCEHKHSWRNGGDNEFRVFKVDLADINVVNPFYDVSVTPTVAVASQSDVCATHLSASS